MSEPNRGLILELMEACRDRDGAQKGYDEYIKGYKIELAEKKELLSKARQRVQEIEAELVNPYQSDRPLLAAISAAGRNGPPEQAADTRKRGPTARVDAASEKPKRKPRADGSDRRIAPRLLEPAVPPQDSLDDQYKQSILEGKPAAPNPEADLDQCIEDATHPDGPASSRWNLLRDRGCDDAKILEILRAIWPSDVRYTPPSLSPPARPGFTVKGGAVPKFWLGARQSKDQPPILSGLQLADRVRIVLDLPRVPVPVVAAPSAPKRRKAVKT